MIASETQRIFGFDVLRIAGAVAVVWIHGCDTNAWTRRLSGYAAFAVPCFLLMSAFLAQRRVLLDPLLPASRHILHRLRRLLPAYATWTVIYLAVRAVARAAAGKAPPGDLLAAVLVGGASYQLYFLAGLIYLTMLMFPAMKGVARIRFRAAACAGLLIASSLLWACYKAFAARVTLPAAYVMVIPMASLVAFVPVGMAAALWAGGRAGRVRPAWPVAGLCVTAALLALHTPALRSAREMIYPLCIFAAALYLPGFQSGRAAAVVRRLSDLSFGMYLVHGLFVEGAQRGAHAAGLDTALPGVTLAVIAGSVVCSFLAAAGLRASRWTTWLVL